MNLPMISRSNGWGWSRSRTSRRGMSMIEMSVSVASVAMVGVAVSWVTVAASRDCVNGLRYIQSESQARVLMDQIRREILVGEFLTVKVTNGGRTIQFHDPVTNGTARYQFANGTLTFTPDISKSESRRITGVQNVRFSLHSKGTIIRYEITLPATIYRKAQRPITLAEQVLLRNMPSPGKADFS